MIAAAGRSGRLLTCFQNRRWDGDFLTVRKALAEGAVGELVSLETSWNDPRKPRTWRSEAAARGRPLDRPRLPPRRPGPAAGRRPGRAGVRPVPVGSPRQRRRGPRLLPADLRQRGAGAGDHLLGRPGAETALVPRRHRRHPDPARLRPPGGGDEGRRHRRRPTLPPGQEPASSAAAAAIPGRPRSSRFPAAGAATTRTSPRPSSDGRNRPSPAKASAKWCASSKPRRNPRPRGKRSPFPERPGVRRREEGWEETRFEVRSRDSPLPLEEYRRLPKFPVTLVLDNLRSAFKRRLDLSHRRHRPASSASSPCGYTAHPPHPRLEKTALGTLDYVETSHRDSALLAVEELHRAGTPVWALETTSRSRTHTSVKYPRPVALVLGNEGPRRRRRRAARLRRTGRNTGLRFQELPQRRQRLRGGAVRDPETVGGAFLKPGTEPG